MSIGDPSEFEKVNCLDLLGANYFLNKPIRIEELEFILNNIFKKRFNQRESKFISESIIEESKTQASNSILIIDDDEFSSQITGKCISQQMKLICHLAGSIKEVK